MAFLPSPLLLPRRIALPTNTSALRTATSTGSLPRMSAATVPSASDGASASLLARVVLSPLPRLFVYDHCPFSARARFVLGVKNVKHDLVWLQNDDFATPTALIGKKMVPILQPDGAVGRAVPESMDICDLIDTDPRFGPPALLRAASSRTDLPALLDDIADPLRRLTFVRFAMMCELPEFVFADARASYVERHPLSEPSSYAENFARSDEFITAVQKRLDELAAMIHGKEAITEGGLSYDDVVYFPKLRSMTCVKGLVLPQKIRDYLEFQAAQTEIPLYDRLAR